MARKNTSNTVSEYSVLKSKVNKTLGKVDTKKPLKLKRQTKNMRKFVRRMVEIEELHNSMGWPHPDAINEIDTRNINRELNNYSMSAGRAMTHPDGSLPQFKDAHSDPLQSKSIIKPDGTLAETPVLPGSDLRLYSETEADKFLKQDE